MNALDSHLNEDDGNPNDDAQTAYKRGNLKRKECSKYTPPPIGLRITVTPALLQLREEKRNGAAKTIAPCQPPPQKDKKLKAVHFPMQLLNIGLFVIEAKYAADLVAKCYYAKRKLVWEILRNGLKEKIEIQWQKVLALRAVTEENKLGILEIELDGVPSFFREIEVKSGKQTIWTPSDDFTVGQASKYRRHYLQFPPGVLDQHYVTLLQCNNRLLELSQKPFPSLQSPYFDSHVEQRTTHFHFGYDHQHVLNTTSASYEQQPIFEPPAVSTQQVQQFGNMSPLTLITINDPTSPISDISSSINERINNQMLQGQQQASWNQGANYETSFSNEYVSCASYLQGNGPGLHYELPSHINNVLQTDYYIPEIEFDQRHMGNILQSVSAIVDLPTEASPTYNTNTSTRIDCPITGGNSWNETLTNGSGQQYYSINANLNPMHGDPFVDQPQNNNLNPMHMDPFVDQPCLFYPPEELTTFSPEVYMNEGWFVDPVTPKW